MLEKQTASDLRGDLEREAALAAAPVPVSLRRKAEPILGRDLSTIRIRYHADLPKELGVPALAFRHVILQQDDAPQDTLHELAHIVQNAGGRVRQTGIYDGLPVCQDERLEREAERFAQDALSGREEESRAAPALPLPPPKCDAVQFMLLLRKTSSCPITKIIPRGRSTAPSAPKIPAPFDGQNYVRIDGEDAGVLANFYVEQYQGRPLPFELSEEKVTAVLNKLITKTVNQGKKEIYDKRNKQIHPPGGSGEGDSYDCVYAFPDIMHLFDYITLSLEKNLPGQDFRPFKMNLIQVGDGDAIVCTFNNTYLLVDLSEDIQNVFDFLSFKKSRKPASDGQPPSITRGVSIRDENVVVIISHGDADHVGFGKYKYQGYEILEKYMGYACPVGRSGWNAIDWDGPCGKKLEKFFADTQETFQVYSAETAIHDSLGPPPPDPQNPQPRSKKQKLNPDSLVMIHRSGTTATILTGDLQAGKGNGTPGLAAILNRALGEDEVFDKIILKVPHHGSKENSNLELFKILRRHIKREPGARLSMMISSGTNEKYHFPAYPSYYDDANGTNSIYPQGQTLIYELVVSKTKRDTLPADIYYTRNLEGFLGSVVHKSNSTGKTAEYTKIMVLSDCRSVEASNFSRPTDDEWGKLEREYAREAQELQEAAAETAGAAKQEEGEEAQRQAETAEQGEGAAEQQKENILKNLEDTLDRIRQNLNEGEEKQYIVMAFLVYQDAFRRCLSKRRQNADEKTMVREELEELIDHFQGFYRDLLQTADSEKLLQFLLKLPDLSASVFLWLGIDQSLACRMMETFPDNTLVKLLLNAIELFDDYGALFNFLAPFYQSNVSKFYTLFFMLSYTMETAAYVELLHTYMEQFEPEFPFVKMFYVVNPHVTRALLQNQDDRDFLPPHLACDAGNIEDTSCTKAMSQEDLLSLSESSTLDEAIPQMDLDVRRWIEICKGVQEFFIADDAFLVNGQDYGGMVSEDDFLLCYSSLWHAQKLILDVAPEGVQADRDVPYLHWTGGSFIVALNLPSLEMIEEIGPDALINVSEAYMNCTPDNSRPIPNWYNIIQSDPQTALEELMTVHRQFFPEWHAQNDDPDDFRAGGETPEQNQDTEGNEWLV